MREMYTIFLRRAKKDFFHRENGCSCTGRENLLYYYNPIICPSIRIWENPPGIALKSIQKETKI